MRKLAITLISMLMLVLTPGMIGCGGGGGEGLQPTVTPELSEGDIGKTRQDGILKITFVRACFGYDNELDLFLTAENAGESIFEDFKASLMQGQSLLWTDNFYFETELTSTQTSSMMPFIDSDDTEHLPKDISLKLLILAKDQDKISYTVEFTMPPLNQLSLCK